VAAPRRRFSFFIHRGCNVERLTRQNHRSSGDAYLASNHGASFFHTTIEYQKLPNLAEQAVCDGATPCHREAEQGSLLFREKITTTSKYLGIYVKECRSSAESSDSSTRSETNHHTMQL
jgi:hypothetical protein